MGLGLSINYYRFKNHKQYIGGSKFSNWGGVGTPDSTQPKVTFGPSLPENYFLPSPFLHNENRTPKTQIIDNSGLTIKTQPSNIFAEKNKDTYYNKESKR